MATNAAAPRKTRLDGLQWGRALAALLVVACHAIVHPLPDLPAFAVYLGDVGVSIFFVISGFIMVTTTGRGGFDPWLFIRRRIVRVVPLYYLALAVVVGFALFLPSLMKSTQFDLPHLLFSMAFIPTYAPDTGAILPLYKLGWTLNFEMFFYAVFAALSFLSLRGRVLTIICLFAVMAVIGAQVQFDSAALEFYTRMDVLAFAAGVAIAFVKNWRQWSVTPLVGLVLFAGAVVALCAIFMVFGSMRGSALAHFLAIAACAVLVVVFACYEHIGGRASRLAILLGDASYALYLFHIFVVAGIWWLAGLVFGPVAGLAYLAIVALAITASVIACTIIHIVVERPVTRILTEMFASRPKAVPLTP